MLKKIKSLLAVTLLCSIPLAAQVNTSSPYSRFGLGELNQPGFAHNLSLGGTGIGIRSGTQINYLNPASYTELDSMSFLFDFGLQGSQTIYSTSDLQSKMSNYNIHHLAIAFGITKNWKSSIGVIPYSSVGYNIIDSKLVSGVGLIDYNYKGNGGLTRFYIGNSVRLFNHLSVGLNLTYMFGYLDYLNSVNFPDDVNAAPTLIENKLNIGDMMYNLGFQYNETFNDKYFLTIGAVFDNNTKLKTSRSIVKTTYYPGSASTFTQINGDDTVTVLVDPNFIVDSESFSEQTLFPRNMGFGVSFGIKNKLMLAGDYSTQEWSKALIPGKTDTLANANSLNFGIEYTPNDQAIQGYYNRIHYRLGGYYSNTYLRIRGEQLQDYGMSFGIGLPFKNTKSSFNLGVIVGQRGGALTNSLIKENFTVVNFGLTLHDFWFFKRKID